MISEANSASSLERSRNDDFQIDKTHTFSSTKRKKRHIKPQKTASYRRINTYYKSTKQYKKERNRRKQILQLYMAEHRTQQYIADKLGVSVSTVKRDLKKLRRYIKGQNNRAIRLLQAEWDQELERRMDGLSLRERLDVLSEEMDRLRQIRTQRAYRTHCCDILLDMTQADEYGIPKVTQSSKGSTLAYPYKVRIHFKWEYKGRIVEAEIGGFNIIQKLYTKP